jgi:5-methylcytosine-specific restriction endonuclease McrA
VIEPTKACRKCEQVKPCSAFNKKASSKDGLQPSCRECVSRYNHELYLRDPAKVRRRNDQWATANADRMRELGRKRMARYWRERPDQMAAYQRHWGAANRNKRRAACKAWAKKKRATEPGWWREYQRRWREANRDKVSLMNRRRRARKASVLCLPFTADQLAARLSMYPGCWMCGGLKESVDHVKPLSKGGAHILANFRPACWSCNSSKSDTWPYGPPDLSPNSDPRKGRLHIGAALLA